MAALSLSAVVGVALLVLWRLWPLWQGLERDDGALGDHWRALAGLEPGAWRGLGVAVAVALVGGLVIMLAWPSLLGGAWRWLGAVALMAGSAGLHLWLQRVAPPEALRFFDEEEYVDDEATEDAVAEVAPPVAAEPSVVAPVTPAASPEPLPLTAATVAGETAAPPAPPAEPLEPDLYDAARNGRVERALELIEAGADPHAPPPAGDRDQRSLAVLAAVLPDLRLLRELIARGVDLNRAHAGMTPLLAATRDSWHGRPDAVMTLLANGADPRATDAEGNTPLHFAARSSDPGVAALLRDAAAELEVLNNDGLSPLGVACAAGNWRLARFLLERGARPEPAGGQPALLSAAAGEDDDPAGVQLLLKLKARVDARGPGGRSALHEAARAGHQAISDALLAAGADPLAADDRHRTPLHEAASGGHLGLLQHLLDAVPADRHEVATATDDDGRDLLMLACMSEGGDAALVQRLLALGIDPARTDADGKRAVDRAAAAGRWSLVAVLDPAHALPASVGGEQALPDRAPAALLREGLGEGREHQLDAVAALLGPAELGALLHDGDGVVPAHQVEWLLARGADPEVRDGRGHTPMSLLLERGPSSRGALQALLRRGVSPAGAGGLARFLAACTGADPGARALEPLALELLDHGADPFAASPAGDPPLALAVRLGWTALVDRLLDTGVDLDARDSRGMSPLHLAAALGRDHALRRLVAHGASPDLRAADGQTPLGVALSAGRRDLADWLDWRGWPLP
ncbi:ankyrin repeat domain-containing protein, partial [Novilysobacter arseniciresistens]